MLTRGQTSLAIGIAEHLVHVADTREHARVRLGHAEPHGALIMPRAHAQCHPAAHAQLRRKVAHRLRKARQPVRGQGCGSGAESRRLGPGRRLVPGDELRVGGPRVEDVVVVEMEAKVDDERVEHAVVLDTRE